MDICDRQETPTRIVPPFLSHSRGGDEPAAGVRLIMIAQDFPPAVGGIQTYAGEIAHRFAEWCEAIVVIAPDHDDAPRFDATLPFETIRIPKPVDYFPIAALPAVLRLIKRRGFTHTFGAHWISAIPAYLAKKRFPSIHTSIAAHGRELLLHPFPRPFLSNWYSSLRQAVLRRADRLFPVSRYTASLLEDHGVHSNQITIVPNGTNPSHFYPRDASSLRNALAPNGERILLTVSRLVLRKGIDTTLRSVARVLQKSTHLVYVIVGSGPDRNRLEAVARAEGITSHVRFVEQVDSEQLPLYYNAADIFVMPSRSTPPDVEGYGIVFLEANACEKPVIGARSGGIEDAIVDGETGLLVAPDNVEELALHLDWLLHSPDIRAKLGKSGRKRIIDSNNWDVIARTLYEALPIDVHARVSA